ncbi:MAG: ABC transporter substrate-binding protein, partial [Clostridia bacterium]|nr:ABC transporter substrate-binding protein [Clostridia bacterium]
MLRRRFACALCAALLLLPLMACTTAAPDDGKSTSSAAQADNGTICKLTLPYSAKDVLNPYTAKTKQNQELSHLLYDPLVKASETFEPVLFLASDVRQEGKTLTVTLRTASFTNGEPVTADDVVYSLKQAKEEGSLYADKLSNVERVYATDGGTVIVEITHGDPNYAVNLDFPIIRAGTADLKDINRLSLPPVGCGRYTLTANPSYYRVKIGLTEIRLVDCPDDDSVNHYLSVGQIDMVYSDLSGVSVPKMTGLTTKTVSASLVYLGINGSRRLTEDSRLRQAISFALDRSALCQDAYFSYARPATNLLHPDWPPIDNLNAIGEKPNEQLTVAYLEELGYNRLDGQGYRINAAGERLSLELLFNEENTARATAADCIREQLKRFGIAVEPVIVSFDEYRQRLSSGRLDLYLGEV